ncbi:MAG: chromosome segregation protein SMC [Pirellulaceae bacterium]
MLKALELFGFKSFADKTRFEFPAGITVVVGPNGSGKSNIVDGIKWVLGEQSVKSLRGKEMSDCIFKGSGNAGRKPMNAAEATVVFDNADGRLPIDAPEVHVTRRVYRSGEAEYLINRQPARLKDIKDMFRGTGVGTDAYSIIEQGKVEKLLQASAKDRRAIFEEAAGISRFKAKKVEAQRRLERVDQNMLRLRDIVDEVEGRLKSVRNQASKARRYREYSERLQELRTQVALSDWRKLTAKISGYEQELAQFAEQHASAAAQAESLEARLLELETAIVACGEDIRSSENRSARIREGITQREAIVIQQRGRAKELEEEASLHRRNVAAMSDRAGDVKQRLAQTLGEMSAARDVHNEIETRLSQQETHAAQLSQQHDQLRKQGEVRRQQLVSRLQSAAVLQNQIEAFQKQLLAQETAAAAHQQQLGTLSIARETIATELLACRERETSLAAQTTARQGDLETARKELAKARAVQANSQQKLADLQNRHHRTSERISILQELEQSLEGLGVGVKEIVARAKAGGNGALSLVRGVLADLLTVHVDYAPALDIAFGEASQLVVVTGGLAEVQQVAAGAGELPGRVTFIGTQRSAVPPRQLAPEGFAIQEGVIGRAADLADAPPEVQPLVERFLGNTWLVKTLADAARLRSELPEAGGLRLVALTGELLDEHGALTVGPRASATSLISRRSELRSCLSQLETLTEQIAVGQEAAAQLKQQIVEQEASLQQTQSSAQELAKSLADARLQTRTQEERQQQTAQQEQSTQAALAEVNSRHAALANGITRGKADLLSAQTSATALGSELAEEEAELARLDDQRKEALQQATTAKIERAKSEQRLEGLRARLTQFEDDQRERENALQQVADQLTQCQQRRETCDYAVLAASSELAELYLHKEAFARELADHFQTREATTAQRNEQAESAAALRKSIRKLEEKQHQLELAAGQVRHERQTLVDRLKEDYSIDLEAMTAAATETTAEEEQARTEVEAEIEALRRKINQIGAVNLDALGELDELESRFNTLSAQHKDLTDAKQALERIIQKINADSRRLFVETLEAIRANFQILYRKAFGGGKADIVLEEGVDVLDAGVEIIATPPGKPSFNNSLLSGGEKALTAVALLLAIFQFRPSPFCVLDEVDAPFDEANIGRFVDVLKEFLGWTKFVIVTHSKKTMTAATTLYGVTMQESGVSKRVSVRFDDVTDDGHIKREALDRAGNEAEPEQQRGVA